MKMQESVNPYDREENQYYDILEIPPPPTNPMQHMSLCMRQMGFLVFFFLYQVKRDTKPQKIGRVINTDPSMGITVCLSPS